MAQGELDFLFAQNEYKLINAFKLNRSQWGSLMAKIYVTAEAWARQKGIHLNDIEMVDMEMSMNNKNFSWRFVKKEEIEKNTETNTDKELYKVANQYGIVGPNGKPL